MLARCPLLIVSRKSSSQATPDLVLEIHITESSLPGYFDSREGRRSLENMEPVIIELKIAIHYRASAFALIIGTS